MRTFFFVLATSVFLCCACATAQLTAQLTAQESSEDTSVCYGSLAERIKAEIEKAHEQNGFSGAVLVAREGQVILAQAAGNGGDKLKTQLTTTTLFEIASCTKPFTAVAAVLLQQQGKLDLDASIADYLPNVPDHCKAITVRHLLQHTSGIPGDTYGPRTDDADAAIAAFLRVAPSKKPGAHHEYWNQGYALLTEIIAVAGGKSYVDFCREEIFAPCNMDSSCFNGDQPPKEGTVAIGQSVSGPNRSALDHPYGASYGFQYRGMGGMVTNVWDLWRFSQAINDKTLLNDDSLKEMTTIGQADYALGWKIAGQGDDLVWWHTGGVRGFMSSMRVYPNTNSCVFILSNSDDGQSFWPLWRFCDQAVKGKLLEPLDRETLSKIAGTYQAGSRSFTVPAEGLNPAAEFGWGGPTTNGSLGKMADGSFGFYDGDENYPVVFEYDKNGVATKCRVFDTELIRKK